MKLKKILSGISSAVISSALIFSLTVNAASVKGDANADGEFNIRDAAFIASCLAQKKGINKNGDFNGDGTVNIRDAAAIAQHLSQSADIETPAEKVLKIVNAERAKIGVAPLKLDTTMNKMATARAKEITVLFSHQRPDGTDCFTIGKEFNSYFNGENIAAGNSTAEATMQQWINSPGHYENMINPSYTELGVGYAYTSNDLYKHYWVQIFR